MHTALKDARPGADYQLELQFQNGSSAVINMEKRIHTLRFSPLADRNLFATARPNGDSVVWSDGTRNISCYCTELLDTMLMD